MVPALPMYGISIKPAIIAPSAAPSELIPYSQIPQPFRRLFNSGSQAPSAMVTGKVRNTSAKPCVVIAPNSEVNEARSTQADSTGSNHKLSIEKHPAEIGS